MTARAERTPAEPAERPLVLVGVHPFADGVEALRRALREGERGNSVRPAPGEGAPDG